MTQHHLLAKLLRCCRLLPPSDWWPCNGCAQSHGGFHPELGVWCERQDSRMFQQQRARGRSVGRSDGRSRAYFVELGTCVVLEQTQAFAVQPPVMSLPLFKVGKRFLLVPNHKTHSQFVRIVFVRKQILNKGGKQGFGLDIFQHAVLPGCPCWCNEPSSLPSPPWSSASWCV